MRLFGTNEVNKMEWGGEIVDLVNLGGQPGGGEIVNMVWNAYIIGVVWNKSV